VKRITYIISDINKSLAFEWIAKYINKEDFQLSFILLNPGSSKLEEFLLQHRLEVYRVLCRGKKDWLVASISVYKILKRLRPNVVHCHLLEANIIGLTVAKAVGIKKRIYTRHHSDYHHRYFPKGIKWDKWCNKLATSIIAPSEVVKEILIKFEHVPNQKVSVIHHGIDLSYFSNVSSERVKRLKDVFAINENYPVIGVISRLTKLKGIQYIIPAFVKIVAEFPNALLLIFNATGEYEQKIRQLLTELPDNSYRLIPFENDLAAVYRLFDVFVQASIDRTIEAFGQTYIEALASEVPCVFTITGIAQEFVQDNKNALVVPYRNSNAILEKIRDLLYNREQAEKIAQQGAADVRQLFSVDKMINSLEKLYNA
jgi:glycosyltransferase involved in cell wall biosynthesis